MSIYDKDVWFPSLRSTLRAEALRKADSEGSWITINGAHVHLNAAGEVDKGPKISRSDSRNGTKFSVVEKKKLEQLIDYQSKLLNNNGFLPKESSITSPIPVAQGGGYTYNPDKLSIKDVPVGALRTKQPEVFKQNLRYLADHPEEESRSGQHLPTVGRNEHGELIVGDGNHRAVLAIARGQKTIRVRYTGD